MGFNFDILKKINIVPLKEHEKELEGFGDSVDVEDIFLSNEPSIEEILGTPIIETNGAAEESKTEIFTSLPAHESKEVTTLSTLDTNYRKYLIDRLGIDPSSNFEIYSPEVLSGKPLDFREIRDTKGLISAKVSKFELENRMSCMPFSLLKINKNVVEIKDYHITTVGDEKFVGSQTRITDQARVDSYTEKWKEKIECAEEIRENLMIEVPLNGVTVKTIAFNQAELDLLLSLFNQVNANLLIHDDKIEFIAGI